MTPILMHCDTGASALLCLLPGKPPPTTGVPLTGNEAAPCPSLPSAWSPCSLCHLRHCPGNHMGCCLLHSWPSGTARNQYNRGERSVKKGERKMLRQLLGFNPWWDSVLPPCSLDGVSHHGLGDGKVAYATSAWDAADRSHPSSSIPSSADQVLHSRIFPTSMWQEELTLNGTLQLVPQLW